MSAATIDIGVKSALRAIDEIMGHPRTPERLAAIEEIGATIGRVLECELHEVTLIEPAGQRTRVTE